MGQNIAFVEMKKNVAALVANYEVHFLFSLICC